MDPAIFKQQLKSLRRRRLTLEQLEKRHLLAAIHWLGSTGGDWNTAGNWDLQRVPASGDDVSIPVLSTNPTVVFASGSSSVNSINSAATIQLQGGNLQVASTIDSLGGMKFSGGTLSGGNVRAGTTLSGSATGGTLNGVTLNGDLNLAGPTDKITISSSLTVSGTLNLQTGSNLIVNGGATVSINGVFSSNGAIISRLGGGQANIQVNSGGRLASSGSTYTIDNLTFATGFANLPNDLSGNVFDTTIVAPAIVVPLFSSPAAGGTGADNVRFRDIYITTNMAANSTLSLNLVGTGSTASLRYLFPSSQTIPVGSTLNVAAGVKVVQVSAQSTTRNLTVDGTLNLAAGSVLTLDVSASNSVTQLVVNGTVNANQVSFAPITGFQSSANLIVNSGGRLLATNSTFTYNTLIFNSGALFQSGDLSGNAFDTTIFLPSGFVPLLSSPAAGGTGADNVRFRDIYITTNMAANSTLSLNLVGTGSTASLRYLFPSSQTIPVGSTLNVAAGVKVVQVSAQSTTRNLTVDGTLNLAAGSVLTLDVGASNSVTQLLVNGTVNANQVTFAPITGFQSSANLIVNSGGRLLATNSTFTYNTVTFNPGALFQSGDLSGNAFDTTIFLPSGFVPLLSSPAAGGTGADNVRFRDIYITTNMAANSTLSLNSIGTGSTASLRYLFPSSQTIPVGSTLNVAAGVKVVQVSAQSTTRNLTVDGTLNLAAGSVLTLDVSASNSVTQLVVNGTVNANQVSFAPITGFQSSANLIVNSGGRLLATNSTFTYNTLIFNSGALFQSGDLSGNAFDTTIFLPSGFVPLLSSPAAGGTGADNVRFRDIYITTNMAANSTLSLNSIGTGSTASLRYLFPSSQTIPVGSTLNVAAGVKVVQVSAQSTTRNLTVDGTLNLAAGSVLTLDVSASNSVTQLVVNGTVNANQVSFAPITGFQSSANLIVNSGGRLLATNSTFTYNTLIFNSGALFQSGDLSGNAFDTTIFLPSGFVPLLSSPAAGGTGADNVRFRDIYITTNMAANSTLSLNLVGTGSTASLRYLFPSSQTIPVGSTLNVAAGVKVVQVSAQSTTRNLTVDGTLNLAAGSVLTLDVSASNSVTQLVVNGTVNANQVSFAPITGFQSSANLIVNSGGRLLATNSTFTYNRVILNSGSVVALDANVPGQFQFGGGGASQKLTNFTSITAKNGATILVPQSLSVDGSAITTISPTSSMIVSGNLLGNTQSPAAYNPQGAVTLNGGGNAASPTLLEAMSKDVGTTASAFNNNFAYGTLTIGPNTYVKLVNQSDNSPTTEQEAIYANSIVISTGATLNLDGMNVVTKALQQGGTVVNGSITVIADSGALSLDTPTPGALSVAGQLDEWSFFSWAGKQVSVAVQPGGSGANTPVAPQLNWVRVELLDVAGNVMGSAFNTSAGTSVAIVNAVIPSSGIYRVRINAPIGHLASTGNYIVTAWDSTPNVRDMELNRTVSGSIATPFSQDQLNFSAASGTQVKFDFVNASTTGLSFTLRGPNGYTAFTDIVDDSSLLTLPFDGAYSLTTRGPTGAQGSYAFVMRQTTVTDVALGSTFTGTLFGNNDARIFRVNVPANQVLTLNANDETTTDRIEMYARFGAPPTREVFEYRYGTVGNSQQILIPGATAGVWYVLVYAANVPAASNFTFSSQGANAKVTSVLPERAGNALPVHMSIQGAGFANGTTVELIAPNGTTVYAPTSFTIDSYTQIKADFPVGLPAGNYSVRVTRSGNVDTLNGALQVTVGGQAQLETQLIMPPVLGRRTPATLYVEYANTGDLAMPAPLVILQSTDADDSDKPILSLDENRRTQDFWTSVGAVLPPGTSHSILLLASGKQPGILNPGERVRIPVYYMGLLFPWANDSLIEMELRYWTQDDTSAIDWPSRQESLRPPTLGTEQWSAVFGNLIADIPTTGDYVRMLNQNAEYLGRLGQNVVSVDDLWNFEVQQAYGMSVVSSLDSATDAAMPTPGVSLDFSRSFANSIQSRYSTGPLGQGWYTPWQTRLFTESAGKIARVVSVGGAGQTFGQDARNGSYFSGTGDSSTLVTVSGGYELRATNGSVTKFRADGRIEFVRDTNNNRVTAAYHADGRLLSLTHSNGASLTLGYNAAGRMTSATDSAGRVTTYTYDAANNYLTSVTTADGKVTNYAYQTTGSPQVKHSLLSIGRGGTTQFFTYDTRGRLDTSYLTGNAQLVDYIYSDTGLVSVADSVGSSSLYFDHNGLLAKVTDPLGFITTNQYDTNFRLSKTVSPTGESQSFTWCACGSMTSVTNEQGFTTQFAYDNPFKRMTSFTDARGQKTSYTYDGNGNLLTTVYPNGSVERLSNYSANGLAQTSTNRRGQAMSYTYNSAGQVTRQTFADSTFITYAYDTRGNLTTVTDGAEVTTYTYNFATDGDRLKRITYPNGRYLDYTYDSFGRRIRMTDQDNFQTRYEYDAAGRLHRLRDASDILLVTYLYDASGRLSRIDKGNGTFTTYSYDASGQLLSLKNWRDATELNSKFDYTYDSRSRRISMLTLDGTWTYGYDGTGQLIRAVFASLNTSVIPNQDLTYMYDPAGNRIRTIENGVTTEYITNGLNQYTSVGGDAQTYDADGNLTFDGVNTYVYDQQSRLVRVAGPQGVTEYEYDAFGNRAAKVENGARTEYLNDSEGIANVVAEFNGGSNRRSSYIYGIGIVSQLANGLAMDYDFDGAGSTVGITSVSKLYVNRNSYDPFGNVIATTGENSNPFKFVGQFGVTTEISGLHFMRARFYMAETARFASVDPLGVSSEQNFYRYVGNQPTSRVDLNGMKWITVPSVLSGTEFAWDASDFYEDFGRYREVVESAMAGDCVSAFGALGVVGGVYSGGLMLGRGGGALFAFLGGREGSSSAFINHQFSRVGGFLGKFQGGMWGADLGLYAGTAAGNYACPYINLFIDEVLIPLGGKLRDLVVTLIEAAKDPNEKQAGIGYGPQAFVANNTAIPYRIDFENYEEATAPAQVVTITDSLSPNFDWSSFRLTEVGFGDTVITIPANTQYYQTTRSMTYNGKTFDVLIELGLKAAAGEVFALFQSLDSNSQLPPDVLTGFLPPEDGSGRGKGYISYTIRPKVNLATGTEIRNVALISFDGQQTIGTDQVDPLDPTKGIDLNKQARITIDAGLPTSLMSALPPIVTTSSFTLDWAGADDVGGAGIAGYDLYVSTNNGPFIRTLSNTPDTSTVFQGAFGNTYRFFTAAIDNTGQRQPTPTSGFVVTQAIDPRSTTLTVTSSKPIGAVYGDSINYSVAVAALLPSGPLPTGTIQWQVDGNNVGSPVTLNSGIATLSVPRLAAGQHVVRALFHNTDGNYDDKTSEDFSQFIAKANLAVTAQNASKLVTDSMPTFNVSITGFLPGDDAFSSLTGTPQLTVTSQADYIAGVYPITGSQGSLVSANYAFQFVSGQLTVYSLVANERVYHRGSSFSQGGTNINAALDSGKVIAQSGSVPLALGYLNLINATRGINGIVLDVAGLSGQALTADDFVFRMSPTGLFNESANPPSSWTPAPTPTAIAPTASAPSTVGRIRLEWDDNAIANRWLQIQVLPSTRTGLLRTQVFYLGHLQGEVNGTVTGGAFFVTTQDQSAVLPLGVANVASNRDLDKNGFVTTQDLTAVRNAITAGRTLRVITIPAAGSLNEGAVSGGQNFVLGNLIGVDGKSDLVAESEANLAFPIDVKVGLGIINGGNYRSVAESHQLDLVLVDQLNTLTNSSFTSTTKFDPNSCPAIKSLAKASENLSMPATKQRKTDRLQLVDDIMAEYSLGEVLT